MAAGHGAPADLAIALSPAILRQIVWVLLAFPAQRQLQFFASQTSQSTTADAQKVCRYHNMQRDEAV